MSQSIIEIKNISKKYNIIHQEEGGSYVALRDVLMNIVKSPFKFARYKTKAIVGRTKKEKFWALRDISFSVKKGEAVGIIGKNGAGKTTLLKILSRITPPTEGEAIIRGRVNSLLEVGIGFHTELTGGENIYLSGAILGMSKKEIDSKFDDIVKFAEIQKFQDTPVKRYSSGMRVRLGFAVAAYLEPDILLVDEVLAVGDAEFQKKCLGKMDEVTKIAGRTILFVSHNMAAIQNLCKRCILLEEGKIKMIGETGKIIQYYLENLQKESRQDLSTRKDRTGMGRVYFTEMHFEDIEGNIIQQGTSGKPLVVVCKYKSQDDRILRNCVFSIVFYNSMGQRLFKCVSEVTNPTDTISLPPSGTIKCLIPKLPLSKSRYILSPFIKVAGDIEDSIEGGTILETVDGDFFNTGVIFGGWDGKGLLVSHKWLFEKCPQKSK